MTGNGVPLSETWVSELGVGPDFPHTERAGNVGNYANQFNYDRNY